jgi:hypothetical protein
MKLSELYERIGQVLREHGDMDVIRIRSLDIDGIIQNDFTKNNIKYSSEDFDILTTSVDEYTINKYFVIKTPFYDK